jgi:hypothetical protein
MRNVLLDIASSDLDLLQLVQEGVLTCDLSDLRRLQDSGFIEIIYDHPPLVTLAGNSLLEARARSRRPRKGDLRIGAVESCGP